MDILHRDIAGSEPGADSAAPLSFDIRIGSRSAATEYVRSLPAGYSGALLALFLDSGFNLLAIDRLGQGNAAECGLDPVGLVRRGAGLGAVGFVLVHHAPHRISGGTSEEFKVTRAIRKAGESADVHLLDHLILAGGKTFDISL